jgi:hypothetical protein
MVLLKGHRIGCFLRFKATAVVGYDVIPRNEKYNAVILGIKIAEGKDNQPESGCLVDGPLVNIGVAIGQSHDLARRPEQFRYLRGGCLTRDHLLQRILVKSSEVLTAPEDRATAGAGYDQKKNDRKISLCHAILVLPPFLLFLSYLEWLFAQEPRNRRQISIRSETLIP